MIEREGSWEPVSSRLLEDVQGPDTLLVDFDHTLFGSNSTELFILAARPKWFASIILAVMRDFFPWRFFSIRRWGRARDYITIILIIFLSPWNLLSWRRNAPALFQAHTDHPLAAALMNRPASRTAIVSFGFAPIIRPLLKESFWQNASVICTPWFPKIRSLQDRKLELIKASGSPLDLSTAIFITDSEDDMDVLNAVKTPYLIKPVGALIQADLSRYFPLRYTARAKYGRDHVLDQVLFVDFIIMILATWSGGGDPLVGMLGRSLLFMSFIAVYEIGYFENDMESARFEVRPTLKPDVIQYRDFPLPRHAWAWALVLGFCAAVTLELPDRRNGLNVVDITLTFGKWVAILVLTRMVFSVYNKKPAENRMSLYSILQCTKYLSIPVIVSSSVIGVALLIAQVFTMSATYCTYRTGGNTARFPREKFRLVGFLAITAGIATTESLPAFLESASLALIAGMWCLWRVYRHPARTFILRNLRSLLRNQA